MPSQRAENQKLLGFYADIELLSAIDGVRGTKSRSQWLRDAVRQEMDRCGVHLPEKSFAALDRAGKGGRKRPETRTLKKRAKVHRSTENIGISPGVDGINSGNATGYPTPADEAYRLNDSGGLRTRGLTHAERVAAAKSILGRAGDAARRLRGAGGTPPPEGKEGR